MAGRDLEGRYRRCSAGRPRDEARSFARQRGADALLAVGVSIGFAMAFAAGQFFAQILHGVSAHDPLTYSCAIVLMALVAFVACSAPARRAIRIDPLTALRAE